MLENRIVNLEKQISKNEKYGCRINIELWDYKSNPRS